MPNTAHADVEASDVVYRIHEEAGTMTQEELKDEIGKSFVEKPEKNGYPAGSRGVV